MALPQGINQATFRIAIVELRDRLGEEHVEFVTKLDDGWYDLSMNTFSLILTKRLLGIWKVSRKDIPHSQPQRH